MHTTDGKTTYNLGGVISITFSMVHIHFFVDTMRSLSARF